MGRRDSRPDFLVGVFIWRFSRTNGLKMLRAMNVPKEAMEHEWGRRRDQ